MLKFAHISFYLRLVTRMGELCTKAVTVGAADVPVLAHSGGTLLRGHGSGKLSAIDTQ